MPAQTATRRTAYYLELETAPPLRQQLVGNDGLPIDLTGHQVFITIAYRRWSYYYSPTEKIVDDFEIAVVTAARAQDKPVLAICRGLQLLNVALGGTLAQDVLVSGTAHELINKDTDRVELNARRHVVQLEPESVLAGLYQSSEAKVNTLHHQGIERLAPELIVEARTDDGLIEAARCDGAWWALGVQWHPERMEGEHRELFHAFREAISG